MIPYSIIIILGPTASGKSSLGIRLAQQFGGVIFSADSRQVYRGMDLGTGKVTAREMDGVPHFLLDVASPSGQYSVDRYVRDVKKVLKQIDPSVPIFLVGGSPFYIQAITDPGSFSSVPPNPKLRRRLELLTTKRLAGMLKNKNVERWKNIDRKNRRRLVRAIEIASSKRVAQAPNLPPMNVLKIGITIPRQELYKKIDQRVVQRLRQGMISEVRRLHQQGLSWRRLDEFGLEYRYISRFLRGLMTRDEMVAQLQSAIHHFAKRQMTWWKRDREIRWITSPIKAKSIVKGFLKT